MTNLPSIQTLRAFEAASRLQSYSRAASELGLTHGAISHRIRELESRIGTRLFERTGNRMAATPEAMRLLPKVRHALMLLGEAFPATAPSKRRHLGLSVLPSFAARWLVPRLGAFRADHPEIDIELDARLELASIGEGGIDAAIRYGRGDWQGLRVVRLAGELLFPVCSPDYRQRVSIERPDDLARCMLLRNRWQPWTPWLAAAGLDLTEPVAGPGYDDAGLLLEAAAAGEGVALARELLVEGDLASGKLVRPFDTAVVSLSSYYLVRSRGSGAADAAIDAFAAWLEKSLFPLRNEP